MKQRMLLLGLLGAVVLVAAGSWLWYPSLRHRTVVGGLEFAYRTAPPDDKELRDWLLRQIGVEEVWMWRGLNRPGQFLQMEIIMQRDRQGNPPIPDIRTKAGSLGYKPEEVR